jgi:hypothetical protein
MKVLGWIVGLIVLVVAGVIAYVAMNSGSLVKTAIEELGPDFLGVDVAVSEVNLALMEGSAQIKGLVVGNPSGFNGPHMMKLDEIKVVLDPNQISDTLVVMKEVLIDGAEIAAIAQGQRTNFQQLMDNLEGAGGSSSAPTEDTADSAASEMKFIIDSFAFTNAGASLNSDVLGDLELDMPDIRLSDIGRKSNGATASEIAEQILKPISAAISSEAVKQGLDLEGVQKNIEENIREKIGSGLRSLTDRFKKSSD